MFFPPQLFHHDASIKQWIRRADVEQAVVFALYKLSNCAFDNTSGSSSRMRRRRWRWRRRRGSTKSRHDGLAVDE